MIAAGVFYSRQSAFWVRCSLFVCATYAHQKEVNFCVPFVRVCVLPSPYGCICVCVCVCCSVLVFVLCRLTLSCLFAQHLKGQRQRQANNQPGASQVLSFSLCLAPSRPAFICIYIRIYQDIYISASVCVIPMQLEPKMGTGCQWSLSPSPASAPVSFSFFSYPYSGYKHFG